jgi:ribosomal protein S20
MPVLKHAKKKQRQDKKRTKDNLKIKEMYKKMIKYAKANPTSGALSKAFSSIDKAAKKNIIHKNKAARLKSALSKAITITTPEQTSKSKKSIKSAKAAKSVRTAKKAAKAKTSLAKPRK